MCLVVGMCSISEVFLLFLVLVLAVKPSDFQDILLIGQTQVVVSSPLLLCPFLGQVSFPFSLRSFPGWHRFIWEFTHFRHKIINCHIFLAVPKYQSINPFSNTFRLSQKTLHCLVLIRVNDPVTSVFSFSPGHRVRSEIFRC